MFPVPSHLPQGKMQGSGSISDEKSAEERPDPVLDLLSPLLSVPNEAGPSRWTSAQVRDVRDKLQSAVKARKARGHELVISNYPQISSNIRVGVQIGKDHRAIANSLRSLEAQLDSSDPATAFLPPVVKAAQRHFSAAQRKALARSHLAALRALKKKVEKLEKLEEAVWDGRGADDWVVDELEQAESSLSTEDTESGLRGASISQSIRERLALLRSMIVEQVTDGYAQAVAFSVPEDGVHGTTMIIQSKTELKRPRIPRPEHAGAPARSSKPPPYSIPHLYCTLHRLSSLTHLLDKLRSHITRDLLRHLVEGDRRWRLDISKGNTTSTVRLEACESRSASDVLDDIADLLDCVGSVVLPASDPPLDETNELLATLHRETFEAVLHHLIIPALPTTVSTVQTWLDLLLQAVDCEAASFPSKEGETQQAGVLKHFFDVDAGTTWARSRREKVIEDVRRLVSGGWGGWEGREVEFEKDVMVLVEVEEDEPEVGVHPETADTAQVPEDEGSGWGFQDDSADKEASEDADMPSAAPGTDADAEDGWAFDQPSNEPGPVKAAETPAAEGEGWDFDFEATPAPAPPPPALKKPAREAKKLGKKLAKAKANEDEDRGSEADGASDMTGSAMDVDRETEPTQVDDGWGWDESEESQAGAAAKSDTNAASHHASTALAVQPKKRTVLKEEKRTIKEVMLVSRSCDKVLEIGERVKREVQELENATLPASFAEAHSIVSASLQDTFEVYRALMPVLYANQIRDVPSIAMQMANDHAHLAKAIQTSDAVSATGWDGQEQAKKLRAAGDAIFELQLQVQRSALMDILDGAQAFRAAGTDAGFERIRQAINGVLHNIESLARVLKPVLTHSACLDTLGYLVDVAVARISADILSLADITEIESERLAESMKLLLPLESLFPLDRPDRALVPSDHDSPPSSIVAHVPNWLKFNYLEEILTANLVDITYLFENGALVDFSVDELVSIVRALFADSEKRDKAIETFERGHAAASGPLSAVAV